MNYSPQLLIEKLNAGLQELATSRRFLIGLSGGLDSVVLLHSMAQLRDQSNPDMRLRAVHVNHQLHPAASSWAQHCEAFCKGLGIEFITSEVSIPDKSGIENAAREARYRAFEDSLFEGEELLLAHHRDDQMETLLLRLTRGAGSRGLSGIPRSRALGRGRLLRPLLEIDRDELRRYAEAVELDWVEDASNGDERFDRNYCRHSLLPLIEERWPRYRESWSKTIALAGESELLIQELAAIDLQAIATETQSVLHRQKLLALSEPRRRNVLRYCLGRLGAPELGWNQLQQLSKEVLVTDSGSFIGSGFEVHCFRDGVYILDATALGQAQNTDSAARTLELPLAEVVSLKNNGSLSFRSTRGEGLAAANLGSLSVRYRQGGESCKLLGRPSKTLKKILQEVETPPWLRGRYPLLFSGKDLACIPGVGVCEEFAAQAGDLAYLVNWCQPDLRLGG